MEVLTIVLLSLLSIASSGGVIADAIAASRIRDRLISIEQHAVRIDNSPSYQIAQGKVQKLRIATRGVKIEPNLRIEALELETDRVDLNLDRLNLDSIDKLRESLDRPFQGAIRLVVTETDLNRALQSPEILARIQEALNGFVSGTGSTNLAYQLRDLQLELLPIDRLRVKLELNRASSVFDPQRNSQSKKTLVMVLEFGIDVVNGKEIAIVEPQGTVNGRPMSSRLLNGFAVGIGDRLNLDFLSQDGILARILQLEIDEDELNLASFLKVETKTNRLSSKDVKVVPKL